MSSQATNFKLRRSARQATMEPEQRNEAQDEIVGELLDNIDQEHAKAHKKLVDVSSIFEEKLEKKHAELCEEKKERKAAKRKIDLLEESVKEKDYWLEQANRDLERATKRNRRLEQDKQALKNEVSWKSKMVDDANRKVDELQVQKTEVEEIVEQLNKNAELQDRQIRDVRGKLKEQERLQEYHKTEAEKMGQECRIQQHLLHNSKFVETRTSDSLEQAKRDNARLAEQNRRLEREVVDLKGEITRRTVSEQQQGMQIGSLHAKVEQWTNLSIALTQQLANHKIMLPEGFIANLFLAGGYQLPQLNLPAVPPMILPTSTPGTPVNLNLANFNQPNVPPMVLPTPSPWNVAMFGLATPNPAAGPSENRDQGGPSTSSSNNRP